MAHNTGMSDEERASMSGAMAKVLADLYLLYLKTQNFHWNVTGAAFFSLHLLFEKQYQEMADEIDELAERVRSLGFFVDGTTVAFKKISSIVEEQKVVSWEEMVKQLVDGHEVVIRELRNLNFLAEKHRDPGTVDMAGRRLAAHEKALWMLRSQL